MIRYLIESKIAGNAVWYTSHPSICRRWTVDAYRADHFLTREAAENTLKLLKLEGDWFVTEHQFD